MAGQLTRRTFIAGSALSMTAASYARVAGANDRLSIGIVGCGERMNALMREVRGLQKKQNCEITAVCDIWNKRREEYAAQVGEWYKSQPRKCRTLADICALGDVDALVIATPDFAHSTHLAFAARAGKDCYIEKPLGMDLEQLKEAVKAVRETGRIAQMGTQARRRGSLLGAREFIKSGGLGKITYGEIYEPIMQERWRLPGCEKELAEDDTDWKEFQSYLYDPARPFNARHYREFRLFYPWSSGCIAQWMSHVIDQIHIVMNDELPRYAVAWGGVYLWKDGRTTPDTIQALLEYPSGMLVTYHMRMGNSAGRRGPVVYGTKGTLELFSDHAVGQGGGGEVRLVNPGDPNPYFEIDKTALKERMPFECPPDIEHMEDFLVGVRTRKRTRGHIEGGYGHAVACILSDLAYRNGCRMEYDDQKQEIRRAPITA